MAYYQDGIYGSKEEIQYLRPHVEKSMPTYAGFTRPPKDEASEYVRKRFEAAFAILSRIIATDIEDEMAREMERQENEAERRKQNLMMAAMALETVRRMNGYAVEVEFETSPLRSFRTPYGTAMVGVKEVLEKFWTGE